MIFSPGGSGTGGVTGIIISILIPIKTILISKSIMTLDRSFLPVRVEKEEIMQYFLLKFISDPE